MNRMISSVGLLVAILFSISVKAEDCESNVVNAQTQGIEVLLSRPQHKKTLNSTAVEIRERMNNGNTPIRSSGSNDALGHFNISNLCVIDSENEDFFDCTYKKTTIKKSVLAGRPNSSHVKEIKYRIGNLRESAGDKCLSDFSIVHSREHYGTEE